MRLPSRARCPPGTQPRPSPLSALVADHECRVVVGAYGPRDGSRKHSGAVFVTDGFVAASGFHWLSGEEALRSYREPGWNATRVFCGTCGSSLGGRDDRWPDFIVVNAGTLDDDPGTRPLYHIYVGSKAPWFTITDSLTQFATAVEHEV
jgi:hypothetical protein